MDIDQFIAKYRPEWDELERLVARGTRGLGARSGAELDRVLALYQRASAHLSEARTRFHDRSLESYLTALVASAHAAVYGARPRTAAGFVRVFGRRYREAIRRTGPFIAVAAVLLAASIAGTLVWLAGSDEARAGVIPPQAREVIEEAGSRAGFDQPSAPLSGYILLNNVRVAFLAFVLGIAFGIPTVLLLIKNGFIVGALGAGFHVAGKAGPFWSLILPHGVLELTAIAIAAGAGLRIGWSLVEPGDRPRSRALAEDATDAATVIVGVVPAFVVAAVIEGFVTGRGLPVAVQLAIGFLAGIVYLLFLFGFGAPGAPREARGGLVA